MSIEQITETEFMWRVWLDSEDSKPHCKKMAGVDRITPQQFQRNIHNIIPQLQRELLEGTYHHSKLQHYSIPNARGEQSRIICTPTQKDKLLQRILCKYLTTDLITNQPLDRLQIGTGVAYGMGKDFQDNASAALANITRVRRTKPCGIKTDISNFYNEINRSDIMQVLSERIDNPEILALLEQVVNAEIKNAGLLLRRLFQENGMRIGMGLRQGMPLSPILASALLKDFDEIIGHSRWFNAYRVADDIICLCATEEQATRIQRLIENSLNDLSLTIPPLGDDRGKSRIFNATDSVKFLGIDIYPAPSGSGYLQAIPNATTNRAFQKVRDVFSAEHNDFINMPIPERLSRYQSILNGYKGYFTDCSNYRTFNEQMESLKNEHLNGLFQSIYGENCFDHWNDHQKTMLGIPTN